MRKIILPALTLALIGIFNIYQATAAHPADEFFHDHTIQISADGVEINWELTPGPLLAELVWYEADLSRDGLVSEQEAQAWVDYTLDYFSVEINQQPVDLILETVDWPDEMMHFYTGAEPIRIHLSAPWLFDTTQPNQITIQNSYLPISSVNWFAVESEPPLGFGLPNQTRGELILDVGLQSSGNDYTLSTWESGQPMMRWIDSDLGFRSAIGGEQTYSPRAASAGSLLMNFVLDNEATTHYILLALLIAVLLGVLHALSPGHGKTVVAAYLVGTQGLPMHAVALGLLVSITHTGTVFLLGLLAMIAAQNLVLLDVFPVLEFLSGALIFILGMILVITRWRSFKSLLWKKTNETTQPEIQSRQNGRETIRLDQPILEEGPSHTHDPKKFGFIPKRAINESSPDTIQWRSLIMLGISSGLVPCPNAIAILLIAVAVNRILFGLSMIAAFSLGLAITLIAIGLVIMQGKQLFARLQWFDRASRVVPLLSAVALVAIGAVLALSAAPNLTSPHAYTIRPDVQGQPAPFDIRAASILYLDKDGDGLDQLFRLPVSGGKPEQLTQDEFGLRNYFVSPTTPEVVYTTIDRLNSRIWLLNLSNSRSTLLLDCVDAICANPTWIGDASGLLYQRQDFSRQEDALFYNATYPSIWWLDIASGQTEPLFQDAQLPGVNPRFSPDGELVSYFMISPMSMQIYHLETGHRHTFSSLTGLPPSWSPDSTRLVMADIREDQGLYQNLLAIYDLGTESLTWQDADPAANDHAPAWSPDGEWIAFNRIIKDELTLAAQSQVWLMRPDSSEAKPVADSNAAYHGELSWSPDSRYLLYDVQIRVDEGFAHQIHLLDLISGESQVLNKSGTRSSWSP